MALTYDESASLAKDFQFQGRVRMACIKYADSIAMEPTTTPAHNTRLKWAQMTFQAPDSVATGVSNVVVMDAAVQADGKEIEDAALQGAVETTVNKSF